MGEIKSPDGVATVGNQVCGDVMRLFIKVKKKWRKNKGILKEDLAILLEGKRFVEGIDKEHQLHEMEDDLIKKARKKHFELAKKYGWKIVKANQKREDVFDDIIKKVDALF